MREMRDSEIKWLGKVPVTWQVRYPKFLFALRKERARPDDVMLTASQHHGMIPQERFMAQETYSPVPVEKGHDILKHVEPGDFIISMRSFQGGLEYSNVRGKMSSAYLALYPVSDDVVSSYYRWLFKSPKYIEGLRSTTNLVRDGQALRYANFLQLWLPVPPLDEQLRIANYLDEKCAQVDRAIEAAEGSIEEYKAYKESIVSHAVIKGLEKHVEMKDSGVEWLGWIPAHWSKTPIKRMFYISKTIAGKTGFDVLSITQRGLKVKDITSGEGQLAADYSNYQIVEPGDFAMNHMDLLTGWIDVSDRSGVTSPDYRVFKARRKDIDKRYYLRVFQYYYFRRIFYGFCKGISSKGRWRLPADAFRNMQVPVPPLDEQRRIADYLEVKSAMIDKAIEAKRAIVDDLKAFKQSLIYEVVTGKREV